MWKINFPREIATPKRRLCHTKEEYIDYINHAIHLTNLFTNVYNYERLENSRGYPRLDYDSAIIDRIYFDCDFKVKGKEVDGYINMLKLHEWCKNNGNIKHQCYFTGSAYSVIIACNHNGLENKSGAVYNAQQKIIKELDILTDPQVMGDIARITRIPNTYNFKETAGRYAIPLEEEQLYLSDSFIRELANKQRFGVKPIGVGAYDISEFDCERKYMPKMMDYDFDSTDIPDGVDIHPDKIPECIKRMMSDPELGYKARPMLIIWLRDNGFLLNEAVAVLKNCLSERKFKHCVYEERQPQIMYQKMMSMYLPRCATIAAEGYCDCENENECGMR